MGKRRLNLTLDEGAFEIVTAVSSRAGRQRAGNHATTTSGSQYIAALLRDAEAEWREAIAYLTMAEWTREAMQVAVGVLAPLTDGPQQTADMVAALETAERQRGVATRAGVDPDEWGALCQTVHDAANAGALFTIAREVRRGNARVARALQGVEAGPPPE